MDCVLIKAKFNSVCSETNGIILKGELCAWSKQNNAVYCTKSSVFKYELLKSKQPKKKVA